MNKDLTHLFNRYREPIVITALGVLIGAVGLILQNNSDMLLLLSGSIIFIAILLALTDVDNPSHNETIENLYNTAINNSAEVYKDLLKKHEYYFVPKNDGEIELLVIGKVDEGNNEPVEIRLHPSGSILFSEFIDRLKQDLGSDPALEAFEVNIQYLRALRNKVRSTQLYKAIINIDMDIPYRRSFQDKLSNTRTYQSLNVEVPYLRDLKEDLSSDPDVLTEQLVDGVIHQFELANKVVIEEVTDDSVTYAVSGSEYGTVTMPDHPLPSFLGVGLAKGLKKAVLLEVKESEEKGFDYMLKFRWEGNG